MTLTHARTARPRPVTALLWGLLLLALVASGQVIAIPSASAVGAPVLIDDFAGNARGTRTVTTLPAPDSSTTTAATFNEAGGQGTMRMYGNGNAVGGVQLDYAFPATDLTSGGGNTQFLLELASLQRLPEQTPGETAANVSITVTDSSGATSTYGTGLGNSVPANVVLNFDCSRGFPCFSSAIAFTAVTKVSVLVQYPRNYDSSGASTTAVVDTIRATPTGGAVPSRPATSLTSSIPGSPVYGPAGTTLGVDVAFTSDGTPTDVAHTPGGSDGLRAQDVVVGGTAPGRGTVVVTGGPSTYHLAIGPLSGSGSVTVQVPDGVVTDGWGQTNTASSTLDLDFVVPVAPSITTTALSAATLGQPTSQQLDVTGTPAPAVAIAAGSLPTGVTLSGTGLLSGTPSVQGTFPVTVAAQNRAGAVTRDYVLVVEAPPTFDDLPSGAYAVGQPVDATVTVHGTPQPVVTLEGTLPAGLTFTATPTGAHLTGTPTGNGGRADVTFVATNPSGTVSAPFAITVSRTPGFTTPDHADFTVGTAGTFTVATAGYPEISLAAGENLPAGLIFTDAGDGTATIAGTPTGTGGQTTVTLTASNTAGTTTQDLVVTVSAAPVFTSAAMAAATVGSPTEIVVTTTAYPTAAVTASGLPAGLTLTDAGDGTARIAGTPTGDGGVVTATITATNAAGSTQQQLAVTVSAAPGFVQADIDAVATVGAVEGEPLSFVVHASGFPAPQVFVDGLPQGVTALDRGDGSLLVSGTPSVWGPFPLTFYANNSVGAYATVRTQLEVATTPSAPVADAPLATVGEPASVLLLSDAYPAPVLTVTGLPAGLSFANDPQRPGTGQITGTPVAPGGRTDIAVTATNRAGSATSTIAFDVWEAVSFTLDPDHLDATVGQPIGAFTVRAGGYPYPAFVADGLPEGLSLVDNEDGTATISGTPTGKPGTYAVTLSAGNGRDIGGDIQRTLTVVVDDGPVITSGDRATFDYGRPGSFTVETLAGPVATIALDGDLPQGLTFTDNGDGTATIAGTPQEDGPFDLLVTASNPLGDSEQRLALVVQAAPEFRSADTAGFRVGEAGSFTVSSFGYPPPSLEVDGTLPAGLAFTDNGDGTATLAGTPTAAAVGDHTVTVIASNAPAPAVRAAVRGAVTPFALATAVQTLTISVAPATIPSTPTTPTIPTTPTTPATPVTPVTPVTPATPGDAFQGRGGRGAAAPAALAATGSAPATPFGTAVVLLVAGAILVLSGRRRRRS